ncbi:hypothetical protein AAHA92_05930 [Salvia divinorum]|uniref:Uncharacterized protein n=1 Tax=Salvia divinorum TaxID=28513 RepID=A0ABD1I401_SALDI
MSSAAAEMMLRCVLEGSLSMCDTDIERRPYHHDCKCALHKEKGKCSHSAPKQSNVAFPKRELGSKCSFSISHSVITSQSCSVHSSSSRIQFQQSRIRM